MKSQSLGVLFSGGLVHKTADQTYPFQVNKNFYYTTGINEDNHILLIIKGHVEKVMLYSQVRALERIKWEGTRLSFDTLKQLSLVDDIKNMDRFESDLDDILSMTRDAAYGHIKNIYVDFNAKNRIESETLQFSKSILSRYPELKVEAFGPIFKTMRTYKSHDEVQHLSKAIEITQDALEHILSQLTSCENEREIQALFSYHLQKNGSKEAFDTIVASGKQATILHYIENDQPLKKGDLVLLDLGAQYKQYNSDISRTYPVSGTFTTRQKVLYQMVLDVNKEMIEWIKPGYTIAQFKEEGKKRLAEKAKQIGLIQELDDISKYYYHGLGHHLGLDVHDICDYDQVITEGMILTVEPGIYIEEESIGIRIEDDVLVTKTGAINLSSSIIKEIDAIESYMLNHKKK
jgi:Xaa-Pro aminopeptidase